MTKVELQVCLDGWQEHLKPHHVIRVWRVGTLECVAELSTALITQLVGHYLLQAALTAEIQGSVRRPLVSAPPRALTLRVGPPSAQQRADFRVQRRSRRSLSKAMVLLLALLCSVAAGLTAHRLLAHPHHERAQAAQE